MLAAVALTAGCSRPPAVVVTPKPTEVVVDTPIMKSVTEYEDFTGRTEAMLSAEIRPQITGTLQEVNFQDGTDVKKGDLLFVIDPALFQAELNKAQASLQFAEARLARLERDYQRMRPLVGKGVSEAEMDLTTGERKEALANIGVAKAEVELADTRLKYTRITAPFDGRISRRMQDPGNVVTANVTILTHLVSLDKIRANFDVDDRTTLRIRRLIQSGKVKSARERDTFVDIGLSDQDGFSMKGKIDFIDNQFNAATGTIQVRAIVNNPRQNNNWLLSPQLFVRIRLPIGDPQVKVLVPEEAVGTDQGQKFVYVVNDANEVSYRKVDLGQQFERYRVVESGLSGNDRVIVSGLQRVRPGVKVSPKAVKREEAKPPVSPPSTAPMLVGPPMPRTNGAAGS